MAICSIKGCEKQARGRGWCYAHYERFRRYGTPYGGGKARKRAPAGAPLKHLTSVVLKHRGDDCLIWPFARSGQGYGRIGSSDLVHRIVCLHVNGKPPSDNHQAAHICGNGHLGCVNPHHLQWLTPFENEHDKKNHGTYGCRWIHGKADRRKVVNG